MSGSSLAGQPGQGFALGWFVLAMLFVGTATAQPYVPGTTYFGRSNYIEYIAGDLPVILAAPHGGTLTPSEIPNRTNCTTCGWDFSTAHDTNTEDLARRFRTEMQNLTGHTPHVIICRLSRTKLDANRDIEEAAQGNFAAETAWNEFHGFINAAKSNINARFGAGFFIDLHGHGHTIQRLELGYLLTASELNLSDATLNGSSFYENKSSIRQLSVDSPLSFAALLRGPTSFGACLEAEGYPSVPAPGDPSPGSDPYFNGGFNTVQHGSRNGGTISGVQIESHWTGVRDTAANRTAFAQGLARALNNFFIQHFGLSLISSAPLVWPGGTGNWATESNWLPPVLPVASNTLAFAGPGGTATHNLTALSNGVITALLFSNTVSGNYTLAGHPVRLLAGISNGSTFSHTLSLPVTLLAPQTISAGLGTLTLSGGLTNAGHPVWFTGNVTMNSPISGSGGLTKAGSGTLALNRINPYAGPTTNLSGIISLNATSTVGNGSAPLYLAGGDLLARNTRASDPITNPLRLTGSSTISGNGTLTNSLRVLPFSSGDILTTGGTLTLRSTGTNAFATNNIFRVRFSGGGFTFTRPINIGFVDDLPVTVTQLESYNELAAGDQVFTGVINGPGQFLRGGASAATAGRTLLSGANHYTGGTIVSAGTLLVNNPVGSGTGTGFVAVSNNGTLGGTGMIAGPVTCAGTLAAGQGVGRLRLGGGLSLTGTNVWELAALSTDDAGVNFDQVEITDGNLSLGPAATLRLVLMGTATAPTSNVSFWQGIRSWKIISLTGSATNAAGTRFNLIANGTYPAGNFTNVVDEAGSVWLRFVPANAFAQPLIDPLVTGAGSGPKTIQWTAVEGQTYRVEFKDDLDAAAWTPLVTLTAPATSANFTDTNASPVKRFYRVVIP